MSYQVLARKYRPKSFETLVGQEHVVRALTHALEQQRLHHAYLFTGTRGVGKTTLSRILAKSFNCETGITAHACGVCDACVAIDAGRFVDYIEMDAASNRGVDEMAALLEQAIYAPSNARFKVYMIDEVHMLTNHAFNSMLKTLEEPPAHVKFILATTDPQKIPATVLSRCLQFNLKQMPPGHIVGHLENILGQENIAYDVPALRLLAQGAHGSMRDALSLTDQAIAFAAGKVSLDAVQSMLGALDQSYLIRLLDALAQNDGKVLLDIADEMAARSLSYKAALQDMGTLLHQIAIAQLVPAALPEELPEREQLLRLARHFGKEDIQLYYQIVVHGRNDIGLAPDEYAGFTMTLLRMLAFRPNDNNDASTQENSGKGGTGGTGRLPSPLKTSPSSLSSTSDSNVQQAPSVNRLDVVTEVVSQVKSVAPEKLASPILGPAMAALAAARAGSSKALGNKSTVNNKVGVPMQSTPVPTTAALNVKFFAPTSIPVVSKDMEIESNGMPPPWDESVFDYSEPYSNSQELSATLPSGSFEKVVDDDVRRDVAVDSTMDTTVVVQDKLISKEITPIIDRTEIATSKAEIVVTCMPIKELDWDGHWPNLAATLPVRGVAQQLAQQSELIKCVADGNTIVFTLRVPIQTLLSAGSVDKLSATLAERFNRPIRVETDIGAVEQTANAQAVAERVERQLEAEKNILSDGFVQTLIRDFGASILTGSIKPI